MLCRMLLLSVRLFAIRRGAERDGNIALECGGSRRCGRRQNPGEHGQQEGENHGMDEPSAALPHH